jgi:phospholipid/cholesterol/gamma-HCH transport system ATP-binding protein
MGVLVQLIKSLNDALNICSIAVSHDVHETMSIADYIYIISAGTVVEHGTPDEIVNSNSEWTQQFMKGLADGPVPFHFEAPALIDDLFAPGVRR